MAKINYNPEIKQLTKIVKEIEKLRANKLIAGAYIDDGYLLKTATIFEETIRDIKRESETFAH